MVALPAISFAPVLFTTASLLASTVTCRKTTTNPSRVPKNAVLLSKVKSLTLRQNKLTSSRRVEPLPQLECVGPKDVCGLYKVDVMRCTNEGADYDEENIQWSCKASLPEEFKLGSTEVICEGYESSDDPYVLKGSCGVEYRLLLTDTGEAKYAGTAYQSHSEDYGDPKGGSSSAIPGYIFFAIFVVVLFFIVRGIWTQARGNPPRLGNGYRGYGGGDDNDPPPPYDGPPSYGSPPKKKNTSTASRAGSSRTQGSSSRAQQQNTGWRPGFWTGAATGAGAAYAASRLTGNRAQTAQQAPAQQPQMQQRQPVIPRTSFSPPSVSTERHESTGFGGTRRR